MKMGQWGHILIYSYQIQQGERHVLMSIATTDPRGEARGSENLSQLDSRFHRLMYTVSHKNDPL